MKEKSQAQMRADRIRAFREELAELEREGALSLDPAQRERLESHLHQTLRSLASQYDIDTTASQKQISWGMRIVSTLGAVAMGASVVMFLRRYWGSLDIPWQVALLVAVPLLVLYATDAVARRERARYFTSLMALATFAAFVANVAILGSLFNLTPSPNAMLAWGAFGVLLAYLFGVRLVLVAGVGCLCGYLAAGFSSWWGGHWMNFGERPEHFLAGALVLIGVPLFPPHRRFVEFNRVYLGAGLGLLFLALLILSHAGHVSYLPWRIRRVEDFYEVLAFAAAAAAIGTGIRRRRPVVAYAGAAYFTVLLYWRFFDWWWDWMPGYLFFLILGLIAVALLAVFRRLRGRLLEAT